MWKQWAAAEDSQLKKYGLLQRPRLTTDECSQLEIWRLVSQAPNLEVLKVRNLWSGTFAQDLPPVWLLPIALVASRIHVGLATNGWFDKLRSLKVNMEGQCGLYLALFFSTTGAQMAQHLERTVGTGE